MSFQFDNPKKLFDNIPKDLGLNLAYRKGLHSFLEKDEGAQSAFLALMLEEPKIFFNAVAWTVNPRKPAGERNRPFILRPRQEQVIDVLAERIPCNHPDGGDVGIDKSRDEGATELVCKMFALYMLYPGTYFIVGSRNKELVDSKGDPYTLMAKIDYAFNTLPVWMKKKIGIWNNQLVRKDMQITLRTTDSVTKGETTNESFSAGRRATAMFLDEFGRAEPRAAESIEGSIHDVTDCVIYGSTHWYGEDHPFNKALMRSTTKVVTLPWWENPVKISGLYKTPDYDKIEIIDLEYYRKRYPDIDWPEGVFILSKFENDLLGYEGETPKFVADGGDNVQQSQTRSVWHDAEERKRKGNRRDFMSNIWMCPVGSSDAVFDKRTLDEVKAKFIRRHKYEGDLKLRVESGGKVTFATFKHNWGRRRLRWWGNLKGGRPDQFHNYVIGCDPSLGTGNSNSAAAVYDVNTKELVGTWKCPNSPPEVFADQMVGLAYWIGGRTKKAFLIWENNGGHGINFGRRILWHGNSFVYTQKTETNKTRKKANKYGFKTNAESKFDILSSLGVAVSESLKPDSSYYSMKVYDEDIIDEMRRFTFLSGGGIDLSERADLDSGARARHGDIVIAASLCLVGAKDQRKAIMKEIKTIRPGSMAYRMKKSKVEKERQAKEEPWLL